LKKTWIRTKISRTGNILIVLLGLSSPPKSKLYADLYTDSYTDSLYGKKIHEQPPSTRTRLDKPPLNGFALRRRNGL
jgi:hypothetical protein